MKRGRDKGPQGPSQRQLRVAEEIRHALAALFERGDFRDPALMGRHLTVTEVRMSPDLRHALVWVVPFGAEAEEGLTKALNHAAPFLRSQVAKGLRLKFAPDLTFRYDPVPDEAAHIDALLHDPRVRRDVEGGS
jgi:ribosome-binding factor A